MAELGMKWVLTVVIGVICWQVIWFSDYKIENATFLIVTVVMACTLGQKKY